MRITMRYFAAIRERVGAAHEVLELPAGARVADAIEAAARQHAPIAALRGRFRVAVDEVFVGEDAPLTEGAEVALIPPVAGGSGVGAVQPPHSAPYIAILGEPLSIDRCIAAIATAAEPGTLGGIVTFTGVVRAANRGHVVDHLDYEAYETMAIRELAAICGEIAGEIGEVHVAVEHRVGRLAVGDLAVVVAAGAPHRAEAFAACRALIDRLKDRVPIWKRETADDGATWIGLGP